MRTRQNAAVMRWNAKNLENFAHQSRGTISKTIIGSAKIMFVPIIPIGISTRVCQAQK